MPTSSISTSRQELNKVVVGRHISIFLQEIFRPRSGVPSSINCSDLLPLSEPKAIAGSFLFIQLGRAEAGKGLSYTKDVRSLSQSLRRTSTLETQIELQGGFLNMVSQSLLVPVLGNPSQVDWGFSLSVLMEVKCGQDGLAQVGTCRSA